MTNHPNVQKLLSALVIGFVLVAPAFAARLSDATGGSPEDVLVLDHARQVLDDDVAPADAHRARERARPAGRSATSRGRGSCACACTAPGREREVDAVARRGATAASAP